MKSISTNSMMLKLHNGELLDISSDTIHKYWIAQKIHNKTVFVMQEKFDVGYDGYAILTGEGKWYFFWRDTIETYGEKTFKKGFFNDQPYIKIPVSCADGEMLQ